MSTDGVMKILSDWQNRAFIAEDKVSDLEAENDKLKEALAPFALHAKAIKDISGYLTWDNDLCASIYRKSDSRLSWGAFCRAREILFGNKK